uniref:Uncharacterized protein n=1 Tax=Kryptolebias marmoratus TaxID=37003 RepID=A0A3Q3G7B5_KRYMA
MDGWCSEASINDTVMRKPGARLCPGLALTASDNALRKASDVLHIEPRYRQFPQLMKKQQFNELGIPPDDKE